MQDDGFNPTPEERAKGSQALMRALDILDEVLEGPVRNTDLSKKLGIARTTTHRLAHALRSRGYLAMTRDGFALGPKLLQLGAIASQQTDLVRVARPFMEALSARTGFCVFIGRREGDWSRHLERITGAQRLRVSTSPGDRRPIAETGLGKALLLDDSPDELARLYKQSKLDNVSPAQVKQWCRAMEESARKGIVEHESDLGDGVRSIAAPIRDAHGQICIALSIAGAAHYMDDMTMRGLSPEVAQTAAAISASLGYRA